MRSPLPGTRRALTVLVWALLPLAVSACGSSLTATTYQERAAVGGTNQAVGRLALRNVGVDRPGGSQWDAGSNVPVSLTIVNTATTADRLTQVTSDAGTVEILDGSGQPVSGVDLPAQASVGPGDFSLLITNSTRPLHPATYVSITFTFRDAGSATLLVPVRDYASPLPAPSTNPFDPTPAG